MKIEQIIYVSGAGWESKVGNLCGAQPQLVLVFGGRHLLEQNEGLDELRRIYPEAHIVAASTWGAIVGSEIIDDTITATAIAFEKTRVACAVAPSGDSHAASKALAEQLRGPELAHVFVVSDGLCVNATDLVRGFNESLPPGVLLSGGLAGDGISFQRTMVGLNRPPSTGQVVAIGFYGAALRTGCGTAGGWAAFGPVRTVTRAEGNILYQLDGKSALKLYRTYLGEQAAELPASGLRFPLGVTRVDSAGAVVRTVISIDDKRDCMVFAGDIPVGARVRFMRASYEDIIDAAGQAAEQSRGIGEPELVLCVSCLGRRIVLGQRIEEETENVRAAIGQTAVLTGFYSNGELAPTGASAVCDLHNQTMSVTSMREV